MSHADDLLAPVGKRAQGYTYKQDRMVIEKTP